jgi:hypothetical protein
MNYLQSRRDHQPDCKRTDHQVPQRRERNQENQRGSHCKD